MDLGIPTFVHEDGNRVVAEMKADMEFRLGRVLQPGDTEMLLVNGFAYRETLLRANINDTGRQNLLAFSRNVMTDYLADLVDVTRLLASAAKCTVRFNLISGHGIVTIPQGNRIQTTDGKYVFATSYDAIIQVGIDFVDIDCECTIVGQTANGYGIGTVSIVLDPIAFVTTASNLDVTIGGSDDETDDQLKIRTKLAPSAFSVAGPDDAYRFYALSASSAIVDVAVTSPVDGQVNLYPLLINGQLPNTAIINAVQAACNPEKVRPLSDTVVVLAPSSVSYSINIDLILNTGAIDTQVLPLVQSNLDAYKTKRLNKLGLDVIRTKLTALAMVTGMYDCIVNSPLVDIIANEDVYTNCTGITLNIIGYHDE